MQFWVTLTIACYLNRNYTGCLTTVDSMLKFQEEESSKSRMKPHEASEIALIAIRANIKMNKYREALTFYNKHKSIIVDEVAKADYLGKIHQALGQ